MRKFNNDLKNAPFPINLLTSIMPEYHIASTVYDFTENRNEIRPTRNIIPPTIFYFGKAFVRIQGSVIYNGPSETDLKKAEKRQTSQEKFEDTFGFLGFGRQEENLPKATLTDLTGSIDARLFLINDKVRMNLEDGLRLHRALIVYDPKRDMNWLLDGNTYGPSMKERSKGKVKKGILQLRHA